MRSVGITKTEGVLTRAKVPSRELKPRLAPLGLFLCASASVINFAMCLMRNDMYPQCIAAQKYLISCGHAWRVM